jgi:aromatic ring-opening dioxygenase catalytic subunit (LigB family)
MYDTKHPVYSVLTNLGHEIKDVVKPKAIVALSAHWESSIPDTIEINSAEKTDLIYEYVQVVRVHRPLAH